jgi:hypothetical protein
MKMEILFWARSNIFQASISSSNIISSIVEWIWILQSCGSCISKILLFKRSIFEPFNFAIYAHILVDLGLLIILVKKSCEMMHYNMRYVWLKFDMLKWFCSILSCYVELSLVVCWSMISIEYVAWWCACCWFLENSGKLHEAHALFIFVFMEKTK